MRWIVVGVVVLLLIGGIVGAGTNKSSVSTSSAAVSTPTAGDPDCIERWLKAEKAGIVLGEGVVKGMPTLSVDERTWKSVDFATKTGLVSALQCATLGHGKIFRELEVRSNMTNKVLARWDGLRLTVE